MVLHLQITALPSGAAITLRRGEVPEAGGTTLDPLLVTLDDVHGVVLGPRDLCLAPRRRPAGVAMLHKEVGASDLPIEVLLVGEPILV